ncbi:uncharacterized protein LOC109833690 [Asparagus officinalis]|uniref:uncharacterized protein LOC109833690 n=1 Tax=Asparagus officinalis TaxID=4686 RepID=UPI00098E2246|nr:uncharacterized protein LOC109833690 [Asparagus officinalis]
MQSTGSSGSNLITGYLNDNCILVCLGFSILGWGPCTVSKISHDVIDSSVTSIIPPRDESSLPCDKANILNDVGRPDSSAKESGEQGFRKIEKCSLSALRNVVEIHLGNEKSSDSAKVDMQTALKGLVARDIPGSSSSWADSSLKHGDLLSVSSRSFCSEFQIPGCKTPRMQNEQNGSEIDKTSPKSMCPKPNDKCKLLDWCGIDEVVAEGRWCSSDPKELVNHAHLGPNVMEVLVDIPNKPEAFLWRPTTNMFCMQQAQGKTIAWPADKVVFQISHQSDNEDNISMHSSKNMNHIKCKIFNWTGKDEIVAEGRWVSNDSKMLVNGVPLGPIAMIVWVDVPTSTQLLQYKYSIAEDDESPKSYVIQQS